MILMILMFLSQVFQFSVVFELSQGLVNILILDVALFEGQRLLANRDKKYRQGLIADLRQLHRCMHFTKPRN